MGAPKQIENRMRQEIAGIFFIAFALLGILCLFNPSVGVIAIMTEKALRVLTGEGRYIFPILMIFLGIKLIKGVKMETPYRLRGGILLFFVAITFLHIIVSPDSGLQGAIDGRGGGMLGGAIYLVLYKSFGIFGTVIILTAFSLIGFLLSFNVPLFLVAERITEKAYKTYEYIKDEIKNFIFIEENEMEVKGKPLVIIDHSQSTCLDGNVNQPYYDDIAKNSKPDETKQSGFELDGPLLRLVRPVKYGLDNLSESEGQPNKGENSFQFHGKYKLPSLSLLSKPIRMKSTRNNKDIAGNIKVLEETLESFGVKAKVTQVSRGPAITRYEIQPPSGIKVSRIVGLADDIALSMASPDVRIEAPIPGKAAVGIEVPNIEITMVHLRELLESEEFRGATSKLTVSLGKDIAGSPIVADLTRMPHLLIAGATGSGKSVCLNTMIASILFKAMPEQVKILIIDPKMVELTTYNGIPHLISPVVTDPKKAATALRWAVKEMEYRYELFAAAGVRDISRYNSEWEKRDNNKGPLHFVVVIIDELADLMMIAPADVEDSICRLAQMARAAGIHLVIATQRPSVDVITGLIKANVPSRVSFAVSSQVDSRTILDMGGAEKLLGKGDMLFFPVGAPKPIRVQGAYLSDREVEALVSFWKEQADPIYDENVTRDQHRITSEKIWEDELLPRAVQIFIENGHASISLLQRRLHIGYARAARLIDIMERRGIVGGHEGSKPRTVLMTLEQFESAFNEKAKKKY